MTQYDWNEGVPDGPNNPSNDQPLMKLNNDVIIPYLAENHRSFNVTNGGQHTKIQFNQDAAYIPADPGDYPLTTPVLTTGSKVTLPTFGFPSVFSQLFYFTGNKIDSTAQYSICDTGGVANDTGPNGSTMLMGGFIIKWGLSGLTVVASHSTDTRKFKDMTGEQFPNNCFNVQIGMLPDTSGETSLATITILNGSLTNQQFQYVYNGPPGLGRYTNFYWFAIGN